MSQYHSKYYAYFLTQKNQNNSVDRLGEAMFNSVIDLNPHQVDAALFFFQNPLSNGVILADEVGLGKTIEASLVISQLWCEYKRHILLVVPASLRKQWMTELLEKFHLDSIILDNKIYNQYKKKDQYSNPFEDKTKVIICSYEFVVKKAGDIVSVPWDLIVMDEAHKLRNVYKEANKRANEIKLATNGRKKLLLTATPLQNSLLELFGLISFVDENCFGDLLSFREQFTADGFGFSDLKQRLKPLLHRTLRKQVLEYVKYTNRNAMTEQFEPSVNEQKLYDLVSEFLQREELKSINNSQRQLITLVLRKLLASSTKAIAGTLTTMINRLETQNSFEELIDDDDLVEKYKEDYTEEVEPETNEDKEKTIQFLKELKAEIGELKEFQKLALSIDVDAKTKTLLIALEKSFEEGKKKGANKKALIFTESTRTQGYLKDYLQDHGYKGKIVCFNGTNKGDDNKIIYKNWYEKNKGTTKITGSKDADIRQALVEHFRDSIDCEIMIATESAAEGVNLQFCSLVINYDLPWNPQRIEQRIGRCHRYGQKCDVLVVNFINVKNKADQRVYELLDQKFKLFQGIFGASDEVLGAMEEGKDFEKKILSIYQKCRTDQEIDTAFNVLQNEMEDAISSRLAETTQKVIDNFDEEVARNLKVKKKESNIRLDIFKDYFWKLTRTELEGIANFGKEHQFSFLIKQPPNGFPEGRYNLVPNKEQDGYTYRTNEGIGEHIIQQAKKRQLPPAEIVFDCTSNASKVSIVEQYIGKSGWMSVDQVSITAFDTEEYLLCSGFTDDGEVLESEKLQKFFSVMGRYKNVIEVSNDVEQKISQIKEDNCKLVAEESLTRNNKYFDDAIEKLDKWAEDKKVSLEKELKDIKKEIAIKKTESRKTLELQLKIDLQRQIKNLESRQKELRKNIYDEEDRIIEEKERLIDGLQQRLNNKANQENLFLIRWRIV